MHKKSLFLILLLCFAFLSACVQEQSQLKDCGTDKECFDTAAKQCAPAKVLLSEERNGTYTELYLESRGKKEGLCEFYYKMEKLQVKLAEPESEKEKELQDKFFAIIKTIEGKDMVCKLPENIIISEQSIADISYENVTQYCTGELIDALQNMQNALLQLVMEAQQSQQ